VQGQIAHEDARDQLAQHRRLTEMGGEMAAENCGDQDERESQREPAEFVELAAVRDDKSRGEERQADRDEHEMDRRSGRHSIKLEVTSHNLQAESRIFW